MLPVMLSPVRFTVMSYLNSCPPLNWGVDPSSNLPSSVPPLFNVTSTKFALAAVWGNDHRTARHAAVHHGNVRRVARSFGDASVRFRERGAWLEAFQFDGRAVQIRRACACHQLDGNFGEQVAELDVHLILGSCHRVPALGQSVHQVARLVGGIGALVGLHGESFRYVFRIDA